MPLLQCGELILEHRCQARHHAHVAANAQHEEHEEEQHREELRHKLKLGYGIRIRNECQTGAAIDDTRNIRGIILIRQVAQNAKDDDAREQGCERVQGGNNVSVSVVGRGERKLILAEWQRSLDLPVDILAKTIVGRVHDNVAKTDGQREEHLSDCCIPYLRLQQLVPLRLEEVQHAIDGAGQRQSTHKQYQHDHVRKYGQKIGCLPGTLDAAKHNQCNDEPGTGQGHSQAPAGPANAVVDARLLA